MKKNKNNSGFTLIELMIVMEIIAIVAAIAIPSLLRQRIRANEASAVGNLKTIATGQITYNIATGSYGTLEQLSEGDTAISHLPGEWNEGCVKSQYSYTTANVTPNTFLVIATPVQVGRTAIRTYWVDDGGTIGWAEPGEPGPPMPEG